MKYKRNYLNKSLLSLVFIFTLGNLVGSPAQIIQPGAPGNPRVNSPAAGPAGGGVGPR